MKKSHIRRKIGFYFIKSEKKFQKVKKSEKGGKKEKKRKKVK